MLLRSEHLLCRGVRRTIDGGDECLLIRFVTVPDIVDQLVQTHGLRQYRACIETAKASGKALPKLYLGIGTEDILVGNGVKGFKAYAEANQIEVDYHEVPGSHDFVFMANILDSTFAFLAK